MKRYITSLMSFILCFCLLISIVSTPVLATEPNEDGEDETTEEQIFTTEYPDDPTRAPDLASEAAIVMDAKTGSVLFEKNAYIKEYPASITKVVTCLLALEQVEMDEIITMSEEAVFGIERGSSNIALDVGEQITAEQCFYAMMVESANEAAWALAEQTSGSLEAFTELMNQRAAELGCHNSNFTNANGLHNEHHYSCAYDIALFTKEALKYPTFRTLASTITYDIPPTNLQEETRHLWNGLKMIREGHTYYYEYLEGGKTGYTDAANSTLVTFAKKGDMELICVLMNCNSRTNTYTDTKALFEYCFNNYSYTYPLKDFSFASGQSEDNIVLSNFYHSASEDLLKLSIDKDFCLVLNNSIDPSQVVTDISYPKKKEEGVLGYLEFTYEDEMLGKTPITYKEYTALEVLESIPADAEPIEEEPEDKLNFLTVLKWILIALVGLFLLYYCYILISRYQIRLKRKRRQQRRRNRNLRF